MRLFSLALVAMMLTVFAIPESEARRMGGGRSFGKSFGSISKPAQAPRRASNAAAAPAGQAGRSRGGMMGPIAGLAAGLGIAALASALGFGEELANLITIMLLVGGGILLVRFIAKRMAPSAPTPASAHAGATPMARDASSMAPNGSQLGGAGGVGHGAAGAAVAPAGPDAAQGGASDGIPADFDVDGFLQQAKVQFVRLQAVYDAADLSDLREFTSPEVFAELKLEIAERGSAANQTDVVTLDAELLGVHSEPDQHLAAVRFTGMIRESADAVAEPFDEVWTLSKAAAGGGWVLAGIEQSS